MEASSFAFSILGHFRAFWGFGVRLTLASEGKAITAGSADSKQACGSLRLRFLSATSKLHVSACTHISTCHMTSCAQPLSLSATKHTAPYSPRLPPACKPLDAVNRCETAHPAVELADTPRRRRQGGFGPFLLRARAKARSTGLSRGEKVGVLSCMGFQYLLKEDR